MNTLLLAGEIAAVAALVAGQFYDCYTTYVGIYVQKTAVEANKSWFAQLFTSNKYLLLLGKPLICVGAGIGLYAAANSVHTGQAIDAIVSIGAVSAASIAGAVLGFSVGAENAAANKAAEAALKAKAAVAKVVAAVVPAKK
jgi:hypothetical protein